MRISGATALVTGANRGLGRHFATNLLARGATVYAAARRPELVDVPGAEVVRLDITDPASVAAAARTATGVNLLVNNAGIATGAELVGGDLDLIRAEMDTHFWGTLSVIRAFAPGLAGGAILNVLSALSWFASPGNGAYASAKAAQWNLTNAVRGELAAQRTQVTGLFLGAAATDMTAGKDVPEHLLADPAAVVGAALDGLEAGRWEVLADETAAMVKGSLAGDPQAFYSAIGA
ncbi:short-chain dehydrogenase [Actinoplanes sp. NBRC 14428]|uniref:Short-subunit dehydrogenase n=1 Tax=Pseudosporangium ferrugineum TaxID=439699 RepID=A0A2T0RQH6_9ACTN|nr:SDR family oxidoreductase [Pseudosporangium ferrugineum]PRY23411.1 short-subunit dehydrogenase [Pseudosporangium ferrugineum]BCJ55414.1 short-chain dehydrogenase [Actinoplanes sp. NBRC 14428]